MIHGLHISKSLAILVPLCLIIISLSFSILAK